MKRLYLNCLIVAVIAGWIVSTVHMGTAKEPAGNAADKAVPGLYVTPQRVKPRDANPEVKGKTDLWKLKHLVWDYSRTTPRTDKILAALDAETTLDMSDAPLIDAVEFLRDLHDIPVELDRRALDKLGIATDTPVTANLKGITLRSALGLILSDLELDFVMANEVLQITSAESASSKLETSVIETRLLKSVTSEQLSELIVATVRPDTWQENGGPGVVRSLPGRLVIYQTRRVRDEVFELLRQLKEHEDNPVFEQPAASEGNDSRNR